ncbi:MAG: hypothetical protein Q4615_15130 [Paracoccus aminovorans]|nr:hypothetical protein [Paracoccus aminovorans]
MAFQPHQRQRALHQIPAFTFRDILVAQAELDVLLDGLPREKRELLENDRPIRPGSDDILAIDQHTAGGDAFKSRHHAQAGRLAAARRTDDGDELLVGDIQRDAFQRQKGTGAVSVGLSAVLETNGTHFILLPSHLSVARHGALEPPKQNIDQQADDADGDHPGDHG